MWLYWMIYSGYINVTLLPKSSTRGTFHHSFRVINQSISTCWHGNFFIRHKGWRYTCKFYILFLSVVGSGSWHVVDRDAGLDIHIVTIPTKVLLNLPERKYDVQSKSKQQKMNPQFFCQNLQLDHCLGIFCFPFLSPKKQKNKNI